MADSVKSTRELATLVGSHGWYRVYETGTQLLGFPPTWEPSIQDVLQIKQALEKALKT